MVSTGGYTKEEMAALEAKGQRRVPGTGDSMLDDCEEAYKKERRALDAYFTPSWIARRGAMLAYSAMYDESAPNRQRFCGDIRALEPAVGDGALVRASRALGYLWHWDVQDVHDHGLRKCPDGLTVNVADYLEGPPPYRGNYDLIISNPPYKHALQFVERSILAAPVVLMLLRVGFLGSVRRYGFFRRHTPDVHISSKRPSFTGDGKTDGTDYAWFEWSPRAEGRIHWIEPPGKEETDAS